jgi:hypothetical protein
MDYGNVDIIEVENAMQFAGVTSIIRKVPFNTKYLILLSDMHFELPGKALFRFPYVSIVISGKGDDVSKSL